ncbi:MAG: glycosyltransferase family 4 protein [Nitrospirae bacterium]|nr:glycosyltransferase family 4 protein [Nitrospirota bacterium]
MDKKMRIGVFADKGMGKWLVQSFEPLSGMADITLFIPENNKHDPSSFYLPKHLLTHKHETWLSIKNMGRYINRWRIDNEKLTRVDFYPFSLAEHFASHKYDAILTKADRSLYTLSSLKDKFGYKLIYRYPFTLPFTHIFDKRSEFARRKSFDRIDHFICISDTARKNLEFEGIASSKIDVVHNSVDLSFFSPGKKDTALMDKLRISKQDKVILFVGKLTSWKNPFTLLYASKILKNKGLPVKLILAGQGAQKSNLQKTAALLGLTEDIIFLNFVENTELNRYYRLADVFVMPSMTILTWEDQFPFAVVEAMASGLPVVVTNSGGMPELTGDAGRIYPQGNYHDLAGHLYEILSDERVGNTMSVRSRKRAEDMYDNNKNSMKIYETFKKVVRN